MAEDTTKLSQEEATARLAAIVESAEVAIIGKDLDGVVTSWNRGAEELYGYRSEEMVGRSLSILVPPERQDEFRGILEKVSAGASVKHLETERVTKEGRRIQVAVTVSPIRCADGKIVGCSTITRDISERVRLEKQLRETERLFQQQIELAGDAIVVLQDGQFVYANCAALGLYGAVSLEELQRASVLELVHPEERAEVRARYRCLIEGEANPRRECRLLRLDGVEVPVETSSVVITYQGRPSVQVIARDISERKHAEAERDKLLAQLEFQRAQFETVLRQMPVAVVIAEAPSGRVVYHNQSCDVIFRGPLPPIERIEDYQKWQALGPDGARLPIGEYPIVRAMRGGERTEDRELQFLRGDGSRGVVSINAAPIRDPSGNIVSAVAVYTDVTASKRAEEALRASEARFRGIFESNLIAIFFWKADGTVTGANDAYCDLIGYTAQECHDGLLNWLDATPPEFLSRDQAALEEIRARGFCRPYEKEFVRRPDGRRVPVLCSGALMVGSQDEGIALAIDLTELKRAEEALRCEVAEKQKAYEEMHKQQQMMIRQARFAALGEMIGNIAHQWRQPLNTLALLVQELPWYFDHDQFTREYLVSCVSRSMQVINHMSKTIDGFRNFFGPDKDKVDFQVAGVLAQAVSIVEAAFGELGLVIEVHAEADLVVHGCPNEFSQALLNILVNAKDAILERNPPQPRVEVRLFRERGRAVITINDNAGGIPEEIIDKIFDPYFTTKGPDRGTGIGLFMSKTIIEKNLNGALSVRNTETGAEFRIEV